MLKKWLSDPNTQTALMASLGGIFAVIAGVISHQTDIATGVGGIVFILAKAVFPANVALQTDLKAASEDIVNQVNAKVVTKAALVAPVTKATP
jgi:hypothetical protein